MKIGFIKSQSQFIEYTLDSVNKSCESKILDINELKESPLNLLILSDSKKI